MLACVRTLVCRWCSACPDASSSSPTMHCTSDNDDLINCSSTKLHTVLLRRCFVKWSLFDEFKTERLCVLPRLSPLVYSCIIYFFLKNESSITLCFYHKLASAFFSPPACLKAAQKFFTEHWQQNKMDRGEDKGGGGGGGEGGRAGWWC